MNTLAKRTLVAVVWAFASVAVARAATPPPTPTPVPTAAPPASASEAKFVSSVSSDLQKRFATTSQAAAAGFFRYTDEDQTGAISWVNTKDWQGDPQHPSQLWYDVNGRLLGADFSVMQSDSHDRPNVWGVSPSRWIDFPGHVHFGVKTPSGVQYGGVGQKTMGTVGGSIANPTAEDIVKVGKLPRYKVLGIPAPATTADVAFVFPFPSVWDLQVWLIPNPLGAFAEHNPDVTPSANAKEQD